MPVANRHNTGWFAAILARAQRRHTYFVWPYGAQKAHAACATLSAALHEAAHAQEHNVADIWIVRSDAYEVQGRCTSCGTEDEALRVASHPVLRDYWCANCWEIHGIQIRNRRLSPLQQHILRWLRKDTTQTPGVTASRHTALIQALPADKGNISKSLRNLADKNFIHIHYSPGGKAVAIELTPTGCYKAEILIKESCDQQPL
jgi:DNA-binding MarR family transcriptional regulator